MYIVLHENASTLFSSQTLVLEAYTMVLTFLNIFLVKMMKVSKNPHRTLVIAVDN